MICCALWMADGHCQCLHTLSSSNKAAVAVSLLHEGLMHFHQHMLMAIELLIPLNRAEISGREKGSHAELYWSDISVRLCCHPRQKGASGLWL